MDLGSLKKAVQFQYEQLGFELAGKMVMDAPDGTTLVRRTLGDLNAEIRRHQIALKIIDAINEPYEADAYDDLMAIIEQLMENGDGHIQ